MTWKAACHIEEVVITMLNRSCGYNQYTYCKNNPVMLIDRSGYAPKLFYFYGGDQ